MAAATLGAAGLGLFGADSPLAERFDLGRSLFVAFFPVGVGGQYLGGALTDRLEPERGVAGMLAVRTVLAGAIVPAPRSELAGLLVVSSCLEFVLFAIRVRLLTRQWSLVGGDDTQADRRPAVRVP